MKYSYKNVEDIKTNIDDVSFVNICRMRKNSFIRNRKMSPKNIILYELNKKGLTTKMEILNFNDINDVQDISSPGLFKQRERLKDYKNIFIRSKQEKYTKCTIILLESIYILFITMNMVMLLIQKNNICESKYNPNITSK